MSKIERLARAPRLLRFILVVKFQWHFACGFQFRHCPRLPLAAVLSVLKGLIIAPVGTMGPFLFDDNPFKTCGLCLRLRD